MAKALPYTAGETAQSVLPQGLYIVVMNGRVQGNQLNYELNEIIESLNSV
jgi:hypothetical protein